MNELYLQEFFVIRETCEVIVTLIAATFVLRMVTIVKTVLTVITWTKRGGIIGERILHWYAICQKNYLPSVLNKIIEFVL